MGTTKFRISEYTGCDYFGQCTTNKYTLGARSGKARIITAHEAASLGCNAETNSCPDWMRAGSYYWTMSSHVSYPKIAIVVDPYAGHFGGRNINDPNIARAVVVISK